MNILMQNTNDLKQALSQVGVDNTTMNFSQQQDSQQHKQQQEQGKKVYKKISDDESDTQIIDNLEIIIPKYI